MTEVSSREFPLQDSKLPEFNVPALAGRRVTSREFAEGGALVFVSPDCRSCHITLTELEAVYTKVTGPVVIACRGSVEQCAELASRYAIKEAMVVDVDGTLSELLGIADVPTAVLVDEAGRIAAYGNPLRSPSDRELSINLTEEGRRRIGAVVSGEKEDASAARN